jgi:transcriptional regulator with XRE-family HTH domain
MISYKARMENADLSKRLHAALAAAKMTQAEVARRAGLQRSVVSETFSGANNTRILTLLKICDAMGFTIGQILGTYEADQRSLEVVHKWNLLDDNNQTIVFAAIDSMIARKLER